MPSRKDRNKGDSDYVMVDRNGTEIEMLGSASFEGDTYSTTYLLEIGTLLIISAVILYVLFDYDFVLSLWVMCGLLLIQVIYGLNKLKFLCLNTIDYLGSPVLTATLEETQTPAKICNYQDRRKYYTVTYHTRDSRDGGKSRPMLIRKVLSSGLFDHDLSRDVNNDTGSSLVTELLIRPGFPFSAYPKHTIQNLHLRHKIWWRYLSPILVLTFMALLINMLFLSTANFGRYKESLHRAMKVYAILYSVILLPLICLLRRHKENITYGGEEVDEDLA